MISPIRKSYLIRLTFRMITAALEAQSLVSLPSSQKFQIQLSSEEVSYVVETAADVLLAVEIQNADFEYKDGFFQVAVKQSLSDSRETFRVQQTTREE
jgi:hypothetical protein